MDPNTTFKQKDGPDVQFSQLLGKRIILLLKDDWFSDYKDFFRMLKARYLQMKGTNDEFEVVQICYKRHKRVTDMPWLMADPLAEDSNESKLLFSTFHFRGGLLACDSDGRLVTRTICPKFKRKDADFPFHSRSLEKDAVIELVRFYKWWWD